DGDDWWMPTKLSKVVQAFETHKEIGAIGHGIFEMDEDGNQLYQNVPDSTYACHLRNLTEARQFLELRSFLGTSRLAARRSVLGRIVPIPEAMLIEADEFLFTAATALAGCFVLTEPLACYRYHSGNQFQFTANDSRRLERKFVSLDCLTKDLPPRLLAAGIGEEVVEFLALPNRIESTRLRLTLGRGWPWETVRVERRAFRAHRANSSLRYRLFHAAVLAAATVLPPRLFYRARNWYAVKGLARIRGYVAEPPA